jgi:hypothetical protein
MNFKLSGENRPKKKTVMDYFDREAAWLTAEMNKAIGFKGSEVSMSRILNSTGSAITAKVSMTLQCKSMHACVCKYACAHTQVV